MTDSRYVRLLKNAGIVFIGNIGSKFLMFLMLPLYTKWLNPTEYGIADIVVVYGTMLLGLVTFQIQDAIFVFPKNCSHDKQSSYFTVGVFFLCAMLVLNVPVCIIGKSLLPPQGVFSRYCKYIYLYLSLDALFVYFQQFCRGIDKLGAYSMSGLVVTMISVAVGCFILPHHGTAENLIITQCCGFCVGIGVAILFSKAWRYLVLDIKIKSLLDMLRYSIPIVPTAVMWWAITSLNRPFMERYCMMEEVGQYAAAVKIAAILTAVWGVLGNAWQISVFDEFSKKDFWSYYTRMFIAMFLLIGLIGFSLSVLAPWYMAYVVGEKFYAAYRYIPLLMIGTCFTIMGGFLGILFQVHKKSMYYLYSSVVSLVVIVLLNCLLIPRYGVIGACGAVAVSAISEFSLRVILSCKLYLKR